MTDCTYLASNSLIWRVVRTSQTIRVKAFVKNKIERSRRSWIWISSHHCIWMSQEKCSTHCCSSWRAVNGYVLNVAVGSCCIGKVSWKNWKKSIRNWGIINVEASICKGDINGSCCHNLISKVHCCWSYCWSRHDD